MLENKPASNAPSAAPGSAPAAGSGSGGPPASSGPMGRGPRRGPPPEKEKYRVNRRIRAREVFVIGPEGEQIGVKDINEALVIAEQAGLDLVEVAPNVNPPVCKVLDYGKFKYEMKKKQKHRTKNASAVLKEVRVRPKIDVHDVEIKVRRAREWLTAGNKVQVTCVFRGREMAYQDLGRAVLMRVAHMLEDVARIERSPQLEGRRMNLLLTKRTAGGPGGVARPAAAPGESGPA